MARKVASAPSSTAHEDPSPKDSSDSGDEITRCICGNEEFVSTPRTKSLNASPGLYVQCERCNVWQHGFCMGFLAEKDVPNEYYCEKCEPSFHRLSHRHGMLLSKYEPHHPPRRADHESRRERNSADKGKKKDKGGSDVKTEANKPGSAGSNGFAAKDAAKDAAPEKVPDGKVPDLKKEKRSPENRKGSHSDSASTKSESQESQDPQLPEEPATNSTSPRTRESDVKDENEEAEEPPSSEQNQDEKPSEQGNESALGPDAETSSPDGHEVAASDAKKRPRKKASEGEALNVSRNRKWRSREDEILQRVLEESAREAREAEARRRSLEGLPPLPAEDEEQHDEGQYENLKDEEDGEDQDGRPARSSRSRVSSAGNDSRRKEPSRNGSAGTSTNTNTSSTPRPSRGGRPPRGGRRVNSARSTAYSNGTGSPQSPKTPTSPRRTANGVKKCKPRIPSQRSTFDEMRRRVASILEFSSRTQDELAMEKQTGLNVLQQNAQDGQFDASLKHLWNLSDRNRESLESLTEKLLKWEERFGFKESP